jgi:hypothetical protein
MFERFRLADSFKWVSDGDFDKFIDGLGIA